MRQSLRSWTIRRSKNKTMSRSSNISRHSRIQRCPLQWRTSYMTRNSSVLTYTALKSWSQTILTHRGQARKKQNWPISCHSYNRVASWGSKWRGSCMRVSLQSPCLFQTSRRKLISWSTRNISKSDNISRSRQRTLRPLWVTRCELHLQPSYSSSNAF